MGPPSSRSSVCCSSARPRASRRTRYARTPEELPDVDVAYTNNCAWGASGGIFRGLAGEIPAARSRLGAIPLIKPPYANLVAIDLNRGEIAWKVPFGEGSSIIRNHPLLRGVDLPARLGTPGQNGPMATASGLLFIGGGASRICTRSTPPRAGKSAARRRNSGPAGTR